MCLHTQGCEQVLRIHELKKKKKICISIQLCCISTRKYGHENNNILGARAREYDYTQMHTWKYVQMHAMCST